MKFSCPNATTLTSAPSQLKISLSESTYGEYAKFNKIITARKRSLRRLCFYRCVSVHRGGLPQCMLGYTPSPLPSQGDPPARETPSAKETPLPGRPPCQGDPPARETPCQGDPPAKETPLPKRPPQPGRPPCQRDPPPGPHPGGKLRGIRLRSTAKGEIEGDQIQAHTQVGNSGGSGPVPHPRGKLRGIRTPDPPPR